MTKEKAQKVAIEYLEAMLRRPEPAGITNGKLTFHVRFYADQQALDEMKAAVKALKAKPQCP